jgi:hypothetical protein
MLRLDANRSWLLAVLGLAVIVIILSHELVASPMQINEAVSEGVAGFKCRDLLVETPGGSWNSRSHIMRAALRMPQPCLADLRRRVESSPQYHAEQCNLVEQCWVRHNGEAIYTISFYPDYASFHFEKRQPAGE